MTGRSPPQAGHIDQPSTYVGSAFKTQSFWSSSASGYRNRAGWNPLFSLSLRFMSSVFVSPQGKFIRINFDVNGYIVGANIETCILMADGIKRWDIVGGGSP